MRTGAVTMAVKTGTVPPMTAMVRAGGKVVGQNFGVSNQHHARFDITKLAPMLEDVHERLAGVTIESLPWADFIRRYDRPEALFYLDPPYWGCETDYGDGLFDRADFTAMAEVLASIKGRFILSINDRPEIRAIFNAFKIEAVKTSYGISKQVAAKQAQRGELVIMGPGG
jgi:DNA adenine methylase